MLAASHPPSSTCYQRPPPLSQRRGRSKHVSAVALARQASEERRRATAREEQELECRRRRRHQRHQRAAMSCSLPISSPISNFSGDVEIVSPNPKHIPVRPISPPPSHSADYYSRPPSPPLTLADRIQVAYAHDNITLAKMLLLQLKYGFEITDSSDPRIDTVTDDDFDEYFAPCAALKLEEADVRMVEEGKRRQQELCEAQQRLERLRACERIWDKEKKKLRDDKWQLTKKREEEAKLAEARRERERRGQWPMPRPVKYQSEPGPSTRPSEERSFEYAFMPPISITPPRRAILSPKKKEAMLPSSPPPTSAVLFKDVMASMHGPLFPPEHPQQSRSSDAPETTPPCRDPAQHELLAKLLKTWDDDDLRQVKGKGPERISKTTSTCPACSAAPIAATRSGTSSRSSAALSRTSSWLSFGSSRVSSAASISTAVTTPATSPITSWLKSSPSLIATRDKAVTRPHPLRHSCVANRLQFVPLADCPLSLPDSDAKAMEDNSKAEAGASSVSVRGKTTGLSERMSSGVSTLVDLAKGFQSAYISATLFSITVASDSYPRSTSPPHSPHSAAAKRAVQPPGYRVCSADISAFTTPDPSTHTPEPSAALFIPLLCPFPPVPASSSAPSPSRAATTATLKIAPQPTLPASPYRARETPTQLVYRMRPVSNPVLLRLRALQNVLVERGKEWEGRGRENGLGCGRERMLGIAYEGRRRSGLGCEVRVGVF